MLNIILATSQFHLSAIYLFTTHLTSKKIIAGVAILVVLVVGLVVWFVRRRRSRA